MALTALDFPASPTNGQLYPDPPVTGQPQYVWNGSQWLSSKAAVTQIARTDALGWSGMQVNGSMEVSQELGTTGALGSANKNIVDGWVFGSSGSNVVSAAQTPFTSLGFPYMLVATVTTAQTSLGASDLVYLYHRIEAWRVARLSWGSVAALPLTIAFWVQHARTGIYAGAVRNAAGNRSYVFTYTQDVASAAEYKVVTIPGDTTGTWAAAGGNGTGIELNFTMAHSGTYATAAPNTWLAGNFVSSTSQVNAVGATTDRFRITGVVVLPGIEAPTAAQSPLIMRPYDQELITCQRYWYRSNSHFYGKAGAGNKIMHTFMTTMRATPTVTIALISQGIAGYGGLTVSEVSPDFATPTFNATSGSDGFVNVTIAADARL